MEQVALVGEAYHEEWTVMTTVESLCRAVISIALLSSAEGDGRTSTCTQGERETALLPHPPLTTPSLPHPWSHLPSPHIPSWPSQTQAALQSWRPCW